MQNKQKFILVILVLLPAVISLAVDNRMPAHKARAFIGQDLHLAAGKVLSYQPTAGEHTLVFQDGFSMSLGTSRFTSNSAVLRLRAGTTEFRGGVHIDVSGQAYLEGNILVEQAKGAKTSDLSQKVVEQGQVMVVKFTVAGEVFVSADERKLGSPHGLELYKKALAAMEPEKPQFVVQKKAEVANLPAQQPQSEITYKEEVTIKPSRPKPVKEKIEHKKAIPEPTKVAAEPQIKEPGFVYPVNIAPAGEVAPVIESSRTADGSDIATVIGRFYLWQKQDEKGGLLELQADNAVVFYSGQKLQVGEEQTGAEDVLARGAVRAIYICGDVVMTEGQRTIRADQMYYDFWQKKAIAVNAVMRNFDVSREIPIYIRADKLRQLAENKFAGEDITLTSSEFYLPQISLTASSVIVTDTTTVDEQQGKVSDSSYDAQISDASLKFGESTIFYWPFMRSNLQRPDIPIKSVHVGHDSTWGTSVETRWHLSRLLGLKEPEGVESTLALDVFAKRGFGAGIDIDYAKEDYYGRLLGYIIRDTGEDKLGRNEFRRNLEPPRELRGRFNWLHRHYLPHNWQLTTSVSYASDENFIEGYYRSEFNMGKEETYVHMKRIEDNWGFSLLGKGRINDFADQLEEYPSSEFHLTGQSLFEDKLTLYSDTEVGLWRQRIGNDHTIAISEENFSFVSHRTELDMPVRMDNFKIVPFVAGTFGYDDRSGFTRTLVDGSNTGEFGDDMVWYGEAGIRVATQYWKIYPDVKSRLWDLNQLRHIIEPQASAVFFEESDSVVEQHDALNVGLTQRLQTKRGPVGKQRTVDWMRLDLEFTCVDDPVDVSDAGPGPDRFIWNKSGVPLRVLSAPQIYNGDFTSDLQRFEVYGANRDYLRADYIWQLSETTAILSDVNYDIQSGVVQQLNVGFSRLCWPNLSYYIGSRYLRRIEVLDEKGTNTFTFAATYVIDPRYTVVFSQQFDFDYDANIRSDITLIRRYHRMYCGLTYSADESMDEQTIVFSIWPQGVPEMAIGSRRHMRLGGSPGY